VHKTSPRNYPGSCSQREPKKPKGDDMRSAHLRGVVCGALAPVSIWKGLITHCTCIWVQRHSRRASKSRGLRGALAFHPKGRCYEFSLPQLPTAMGGRTSPPSMQGIAQESSPIHFVQKTGRAWPVEWRAQHGGGLPRLQRAPDGVHRDAGGT